MARKQLGPTATAPTDTVDVAWVQNYVTTFATANLPSYSTYVSSNVDYVLALPVSPVDHQMQLFEINATANINVSIPAAVQRMFGASPSVALSSGQTGFLGLRYSAHAQAWFLLSSAVPAS